LPQKFEKALWQAPLNQVSEPAESEYGWHLFFIHAKTR